MAEQATWSGREALPARRGRREALSRPGMASPSGLAMLAGLIWCLAVALVDVMLGTRSVVIGLEVAGPMMAAAFAGARRTAIVGVTAVGLSVVLGLSDHIFGTLDHIDRMGAVALGSVIAAWVATLRERREEAVAAAREAAARERQRRLALQASDSLHRLEAALGLAEGAEDVTEAAFRAVRDEMQASSCALTLLDELGTPIFIHARGFPRGVAPAGTASAHHELPAVAGIESVPPLLVRDVDKHTGDEAGRGLGRLVSALASVGQKAACVLPLASGAETVGAFVACWERPREFSDEEATWLQSVGAQFVVAVHRTRLVALERAEARRAAELAQLAASLSKAASAEDVATHALAALRAALGPRACSIELSPPEPARLRSAATNENTKGLLKDRGAETRADQG
ncbi:MAG: GAF domain-containing protein, partial [Acidimicrobiales bacterium]